MQEPAVVTDQDQPAEQQTDFPVFVLGSERSGTSTLAYLMESKFGYKGYSEGHLFSLLQQLNTLVTKHFGQRGFSVSDEVALPATTDWSGTTTAQVIGIGAIKKGLEELFLTQSRKVLSGRWFDKTPGPETIAAAPQLLRLYPNALFIFVIRDPIANIESRMRKFDATFETCCESWAACALSWLQTKQYLPEGSYLELKTHEMETDPQGTFETIQNFLAAKHLLPPEIANQPAPAKLPQLQRTSSGNLGTLQTLEDVSWSEEKKAYFTRTCGPLAEEYGFNKRNEDASNCCDITLPPPYGQKNVTVKHGEWGGVWPQIHHDRVWIYMHPSASGETTRVEYSDVDLSGVSSITSAIEVLSKNASPIRLNVAITKEDTGDLVKKSEVICQPGEGQTHEVEVPLGLEKCRITLSTESTTGSAHEAWTVVKCATLRKRI